MRCCKTRQRSRAFIRDPKFMQYAHAAGVQVVTMFDDATILCATATEVSGRLAILIIRHLGWLTSEHTHLQRRRVGVS